MLSLCNVPKFFLIETTVAKISKSMVLVHHQYRSVFGFLWKTFYSQLLLFLLSVTKYGKVYPSSVIVRLAAYFFLFPTTPLLISCKEGTIANSCSCSPWLERKTFLTRDHRLLSWW